MKIMFQYRFRYYFGMQVVIIRKKLSPIKLSIKLETKSNKELWWWAGAIKGWNDIHIKKRSIKSHKFNNVRSPRLKTPASLLHLQSSLCILFHSLCAFREAHSRVFCSKFVITYKLQWTMYRNRNSHQHNWFCSECIALSSSSILFATSFFWRIFSIHLPQ